MTPLDNVLSRLTRVKGRNGSYTACCPAHEDKSPSLTIRETPEGKVLMHCFGGCSVHEVAGAIGLELSDLFPPQDGYDYQPQRKSKFIAADLLRVMSLEATIVALSAATLARGGSLSDTDRKRLTLAAARINEALEAVQ